MRPVIFLCLLTICLTTACSLSASEIGSRVSLTTAANTQSPTNNSAAASTAQPTTIATRIPATTVAVAPTTAPADVTNSSAAMPQTNCVPRGGEWFVYTVVVGDTLASIASRVGSTADELVHANCLSNANLIVPGQSLRVPRSPAQEVAVPLPNPADYGAVILSPYVQRDGDQFTIAPGIQISVYWPSAPGSNVARVEFYITPTGTGMADARQLIGTDYNLSDGAQINWTTPPTGILGHAHATAFMNNGAAVETTSYAMIYSETMVSSITGYVEPQFNGSVVISPFMSFDGVTYSFERNAMEHVSWPEAPPNACSVDFMYHYGLTGIFPDNPTPVGDVLIGTDYTLNDGAKAEWHIPGGVRGYVYALAHMPDGTVFMTDNVQVYAEII
jgi:LysM repeat protein